MESLEGEIEALRQDMAIVNQQTHMLATQVYSDLVDKDRFQHEVIYRTASGTFIRQTWFAFRTVNCC